MRSSLSRVLTTFVVGLAVTGCAPVASPPANSTTASPVPSPAATTPTAGSATASALPSPSFSPIPSATPSPRAAGGWPYISLIYAPAFGTDGTVFAITETPPSPNGPRRGLIAFDRGGHVKPGWPVDERKDSYFGPMAPGPDASVYLEECGGPALGCVLHQFGAGGRDLPGWPFRMPADYACPIGGRPCFSFLKIGSNGTAYLTHWRATGGTQLLAIDPSGTVRSGWPVSLDDKLYWSDMRVGSDGSLFILSNNEESADERLWAFTSDGKARPGWPVAVPGVHGYRLGPEGTAVTWALIDDVGELCPNPRRTLFTALGTDGKTLPGWPRGSTGLASGPVISGDGTVYYVSAQGNIYAHDRAGEVKAGWPVAVPGSANGCGSPSPYLAPDGTIYVLGDHVEARSSDGRARPGWPYRQKGITTTMGDARFCLPPFRRSCLTVTMTTDVRRVLVVGVSPLVTTNIRLSRASSAGVRLQRQSPAGSGNGLPSRNLMPAWHRTLGNSRRRRKHPAMHNSKSERMPASWEVEINKSMVRSYGMESECTQIIRNSK